MKKYLGLYACVLSILVSTIPFTLGSALQANRNQSSNLPSAKRIFNGAFAKRGSDVFIQTPSTEFKAQTMENTIGSLKSQGYSEEGLNYFFKSLEGDTGLDLSKLDTGKGASILVTKETEEVIAFEVYEVSPGSVEAFRALVEAMERKGGGKPENCKWIGNCLKCPNRDKICIIKTLRQR
jgi:hypothetical protein